MSNFALANGKPMLMVSCPSGYVPVCKTVHTSSNLVETSERLQSEVAFLFPPTLPLYYLLSFHLDGGVDKIEFLGSASDCGVKPAIEINV